jgi:hypothetical protein
MHANQVIATRCKTSFICSHTSSDVLITPLVGRFNSVRAEALHSCALVSDKTYKTSLVRNGSFVAEIGIFEV